MTFSKEDKAAWNDSEIMQEFEKIALETEVLEGPPKEAFEPLESVPVDEPTWEEEDTDEEKLISAVEKFEEPAETEEEEGELSIVSTKLIDDLEKLAHNLATSSKMQAAYRIERAIYSIKEKLEANNG